MQHGDVLVIYSDGITEAFDEAHHMFGEARLKAVVEDCAGQSAAELVAAIAGAVRTHAGAASQSDDMTLLVLRVEDQPQ